MNLVAVAQVAELGAVPLAIELREADLELALVRIGEEIFAIRDECSHGRVRLSEGDVDAGNCAIECYRHGSVFDLRTGVALNPPASLPVPVYPCLIEGDQILVDIDHPTINQEH